MLQFKSPLIADNRKCMPFPLGAAIIGGSNLVSGLTSLFGGNHAADKSLQATRETNKANAELAKYQNEWNLAQCYRDWETDRKSTRLNSSHSAKSRMPSSA